MPRDRCGEVVYSFWTTLKMEAAISPRSFLTCQIRTTDTNAAKTNSSLVRYID